MEIARRYGRETDMILQMDDGVVSVPQVHWRTLICQLVDNAFRFSVRGTAVRVTGTREGGSYRLQAHDAGRCAGGPETGSLGPFNPAGPSVSGSRGLGLGMAIVRQVAALSGGDFSLGPGANGGTDAIVSVPISLLEVDPGAFGHSRRALSTAAAAGSP